MRMTEGLIGLMIFGLLTYYSVEYSATGQTILSGLHLDNPEYFSNPSSLLLTGGVGSSIIALGTYVVTGGSWSSTLTYGAMSFVFSLVAVPTLTLISSDMPFIVRVLVGGTWLMLMISTLGGALKGEF